MSDAQLTRAILLWDAAETEAKADGLPFMYGNGMVRRAWTAMPYLRRWS